MFKKIGLLSVLLAATLAVFAQNKYQYPYKIEKDVTADSGMVVSAHPIATQVGVQILRRGGNAIDASIAVHFALAVVYPQAGNIGGGGFLLYRSRSGTTDALDFREVAPAAATEGMYLDSLKRVLPNLSRFGPLAAGVPGAVDGMWEAHKKYGKMPWHELVKPATELAEKGFNITQQEADNLNRERPSFLKNSRPMPAFVRMDEWKAGDLLVQTELASTLRRIEGDGRAGFYEGATAALIVSEMERRKGIMTEKDLAQYKSVWRKPMEFNWKGMKVITMPPPSSGGIILQQLLTICSWHPVTKFGFHSTAAVHLMTEAERRAYADRSKHMGDPDFYKVPVTTLVDSAYLAGRMKDYDPTKATPSEGLKAGDIKESEQTTHMSVVDRQGNAVSMTTTLNDSYGSRTVVAGAGFILNNEMDDFSAKPGSPNMYGAIGGKANAIAGGKRPLSSMTPTIITKNGKLSMTVGTPGGTTIPTSVFQTIMNVYEFGLPLKEAVHQKRFHHQWAPDQIFIEDGALSEEVIQQLQGKGHSVLPREPIGRVEAIMVLPNGKLQGVADIRGDDAVGGY